MILKVCNVKSKLEARSLAKLGVDLLGFHLISPNDKKRYNVLKATMSEIHRFFPDTESVLVTKETDRGTLLSNVEELEPNFMQLHYAESHKLVDFVSKTTHGNVKGIQVFTPHVDTYSISQNTKYVLFDSSYVGGTGRLAQKKQINATIKRLRKKTKLPILFGGGVNKENAPRLMNLPIQGFDVQSSLKSANPKTNIDISKVEEVSSVLKRSRKLINKKNGIGYVIYDIQQRNFENLEMALNTEVDFLHFDISDGFIGEPSSLDKIKALIKTIRDKELAMPLQFHIFTKSDSFLRLIEKTIEREIDPLRSIFVHINRDNMLPPESVNRFLPAFDVRDILNDKLSIEEYTNHLQERIVLLVLESIEKKERLKNMNAAITILNKMHNINRIILDRGVDAKLANSIDTDAQIDLAVGGFLGQNMSQRYNLLVTFLNDY